MDLQALVNPVIEEPPRVEEPAPPAPLSALMQPPAEPVYHPPARPMAEPLAEPMGDGTQLDQAPVIPEPAPVGEPMEGEPELEPIAEEGGDGAHVRRSKRQRSNTVSNSTPRQSKRHSSSSRRKSDQSGSQKRNHNRTFHLLASGSKLRHLKKKDGEPLWRADIQYDFLHAIFHNDQRVFTNIATGEAGCTFADIYVDAMARSSKCSKVLREKLVGDKTAGVNMAMVCLLVNIGRMNTTLNFFPEMKAVLRTYHSIPSLQTQSDQSDYKQLQDAPRLKSILKGACEDTPEPVTIEEMVTNGKIPHTNPINLIFLLATFEPKVTEQFFYPPYDFFDLIMTKELSSQSRAAAFLWLMWAYLNTNLTDEELQSNPFGRGVYNGTKIPGLVTLTPEEVAKENLDTPQEIEFGAQMTKERNDYIDAINSNEMMLAGAGEKGSATRTRKRLSLQGIPRSQSGNSEPGTGTTATTTLSGGSRSKNKAEPGEKKTTKIKLQVKTGGGRRGGKPPVAEIRARKCHKEIDKLLVGKDRRRRRVRYQMGPLEWTWNKIKDEDPIYNSEDEMVISEKSSSGVSSSNGSSSNGAEEGGKKRKRANATGQPPGSPTGNEVEGSLVQAAQPITLPPMPTKSTVYDDYGEESTALLRAFRRAQRWVKRWNGIETPMDDEEMDDEMALDDPLVV
ncbi:hypothetical protein TRVA0_054S00650 [Trichomonascus vanleenenianus]|uniref:Ies1p n=1 Tax=Trichomonascus vanleenenianus TaxID=2268995 RepID=UPI003ECA0ADD